MRWLKQRYAGYVRVRLTGRSPERFFNLCRGSGIMLWNLSCGNNEYWFSMMLPDFYRIRPFVRKAGVKVRVQEKLGLPFFLYRNRKRKLFAAGMASFFCFCLFFPGLSGISASAGICILRMIR